MPTPDTSRPLWLNQRLGDSSGRGLVVALVDSGCAPDLKPLDGKRFVDDARPLELSVGQDTADRIGHGTACARIVRSIAPQVDLLPLRVFGKRLETSTEVVVAALDHAVERGARIINLSLGSPLAEAEAPFRAACERAHRAGCVVVSAMPLGAEKIFPAVFDTVLAVTAGRFTNVHDLERVPGGPANFAACEGSPVTRDLPLGRSSGSSFAAPHVSGLVALLLERYPSSRPEQIRRMLDELSHVSGSRLVEVDGHEFSGERV